MFCVHTIVFESFSPYTLKRSHHPRNAKRHSSGIKTSFTKLFHYAVVLAGLVQTIALYAIINAVEFAKTCIIRSNEHKALFSEVFSKRGRCVLLCE